MKDQKMHVININKDLANNSAQLDGLLTVSLASSYLGQQKSPTPQNKQNNSYTQNTQDMKKSMVGDNLSSKQTQKGKQKLTKPQYDAALKKSNVVLPYLKGNTPNNCIEGLQINNIQESKHFPTQIKQKQQESNQIIFQQPLNVQSKQSEQFSMVYKQKVLRQNQVIKKRLKENVSSAQSNYIPLSAKMHESFSQQNVFNLQIMGSSNQQKLPAIQEQLKQSYISPQPQKSMPQMNSKKQSNPYIYGQQNNGNIFSQPPSLSIQNGKNSQYNYINNLNVSKNNSAASNNTQTNQNTQKGNSIIITNKNSLIQREQSYQSTNAKVNRNSDYETIKSQQNSISDTNQDTLKQQKQSQLSTQRPQETQNQQNKIQTLETNKSFVILEEDSDLTLIKGRSKASNVSLKSQNKGVKFNIDTENDDSYFQKISNGVIDDSKNTVIEEGNTKKEQPINKQSFEELSSILKNKKADSYSVQQSEIGLQSKTQSQHSQDSETNPQVHQVLSRKPTQNNDIITMSMENSTFSKIQKASQEDSSNNKDDFDEDEDEDSFEEEERENELNDELQQKNESEENTPIIKINDTDQNGFEEEMNRELKFDEAATISYKKQIQQQLNEKQNNKDFLKTLAPNQIKQVNASSMKQSTYLSRVEQIKLNYSKQDSKIVVNHQNQKQQFIIDIFSDDTGGGRYDWKINDVMLGAGSQGRVYKAFCSKQVKNFALKMVNLDDFESEYTKDVMNEILLLKSLRGHSPFIQLHDVFGLEKLNCKLIDENINLLQKQWLWQWNIVNVIFLKQQTTERMRRFIGKKMNQCTFSNLCWMVLNSFKKRIFATEISKQGEYKIGDFSEGKFLQGISTVLSQSIQVDEENMMEHSFRGTWKYLSPELSIALSNVQDVCQYDPYSSDLYSLGILFSDLISLDEIKFQTKTVNGDKSQNNSNYMTQLKAYLTACIQKNWNPRACQLVLCLLNEQPQNRKAFESYLQAYELEEDLSQVILQKDKEIALEIESRRENSKIMSQYQKAKKLFIIAEGYEKIFKFEKAVEAYLQVLQVTIYMNTKTIRSRTIYNIGRCYEKLGLYLKSLEYYQQCYYFRKKIYKPESRRMGEVLNGLGIAHNKLGNQQEAKTYYEQSLQIALNRYGQNHIIIANMYNNLGSVYFSLKQYSKSSQNFEQAISILRKINLESQTQEILNNLSMVYLEQSKFDESEFCLKLALDLVKKYEGEDNYRLINIYINLGTLNSEQRKQGDSEQDIKDKQLKSINYYQNAEQLCIKYYGEQYHQLGEIYNLMGISYQYLHDFDSSLYYLLKSESILEMNENQNFLWQTYSSLGVLYNMQKLYEKSIHYFKKSLEIHDKIDFDQIKKADLQYNIGCVYLYSKNTNDAKIWFEKSLNIYQQADDQHPNIATITKFLKKIQQYLEDDKN